MKINTKIRYALRSLIEIGITNDENGILQKDISINQNISVKYLDQIIAGLKAAGIIVNSGGKKSGYILAKNSKDILIYDVYRAFEQDLSIVNCLPEGSSCDNEQVCVVQDFWGGLNELIIDYLSDTSIDVLIAKQKAIRQKEKPNMYYI